MSVSRETSAAFASLAALVEKWNPAINLVSKSTIETINARHIDDSAQLYDIAPTFDKWLDLGSGGGFPALVIAIIAKTRNPLARITMVESDKRKCEFLRHVSRALELNTTVKNERIEVLEPQNADVVSARALAPLDKLCEFYDIHGRMGGRALFPKGGRYLEEVSAASARWDIEYTAHPSRTDKDAVVLELRDVRRG